MTKRLLVTSDDFGMCHAVNAGIVRAMTQGIVRSTNFLVPCPWFPEALALAQRHGLPAGVHLCLTCDWDHLKWRPLTSAPSLCDEYGYFLPSYAALEQTARDEDMLAELRAQVALLLRLGFTPSHADSHMFGSPSSGPFAERVRQVIARVCSERGLPYTYETGSGKLKYFDAEFDLSATPRAELWAALEACGPGTYHVIGHAAEASPELEALCSAAHPARVWAAQYRLADLDWFTSEDTRARLNSLGFELVAVPDIFGPCSP